MKLSPVLTEKSLADAKIGHYTFLVNRNLRKADIKKAIEEAFAVHVTGVRTANMKGGTKKNMRGKLQTKKAFKKAWVILAEKEKIDIFEEKTK
jgi:large subunit ribosomal protein L23